MNRWNAYYFDCLRLSVSPSRVITIEAADEEEAGRIAISKMGRSMRVHVAQTVWDPVRAKDLSCQKKGEGEFAAAER